jgi:hypothetical protein
MKSILANFFRAHHQHQAWWYKLKITPQVASHSTKDALLPLDEAPGEYCLSKLLEITMNELWTVLIACDLARKRGRQYIIDREKIKEFITTNELTDLLAFDVKDKEPVLRIGVYTSNSSPTDHSASTQWRSGKTAPRPIRAAQKKFRDEMNNFFNKNSPAESAPNTSTGNASSPAGSSPTNNQNPRASKYRRQRLVFSQGSLT